MWCQCPLILGLRKKQLYVILMSDTDSGGSYAFKGTRKFVEILMPPS